MITRFSSLTSDLFYNFTIAQIRIENEKQSDLSHNTSLYRNIICKESGKHTISSISKLLSVKSTAVTQKVNELEQKNYVVRKQSEEDKRISHLYAVEKFCPCAEEFIKRDNFVFSNLQSKFSNDELSKFLEILEQAKTHYLEYDIGKEI